MKSTFTRYHDRKILRKKVDIVKLSDYINLTEDGFEVPIFDKKYGLIDYFYNDRNEKSWTQAMNDLLNLVTITQIYTYGLEVNLSDLIAKNLYKMKAANLFDSYDMKDIMFGLEHVLNGNVPDEWLQKFVECLR